MKYTKGKVLVVRDNHI